jgi:hypothetical protein
MSHIRLALLLCNPRQCGESEWRLQFIAEMIPQSPTSQDRQEDNVLRFWKSFQHRNGFPRLGFFAQWLCHENYRDKQREQAILLDIAARNHFKNVPPVSRVV